MYSGCAGYVQIVNHINLLWGSQYVYHTGRSVEGLLLLLGVVVDAVVVAAPPLLPAPPQ